MKLILGVGFCLTTLTFIQPCFANNDPSADTSGIAGYAALTSVAAPVALGASGVGLSVGAAHQVVRLVDAAGNGLSDLTSDGFDIIAEKSVCDSSEVHVKAHKKEIPLVVRKDYLELNQEVKP